MISMSRRRASGFVIDVFSPSTTVGCSRLSLPGTSRQKRPYHLPPIRLTEPDCPDRFDIERPFRCCRIGVAEATIAQVTCCPLLVNGWGEAAFSLPGNCGLVMFCSLI